MHERYVPGTWSKITRYEHLPRYALASSLAKDRRVLDFGCGTGYGSASLARVAASVTGCDLDTEALEWARSEHRGEGLTFLRNEDLGASLPAESCDRIVCFEVIEHLTAEQQRAIVANFARLLAPGGRLLTSTPNPQITALYGENPYHLHELPAGAFRELLGTHFQSVRLFDQCLGSGVIFKDLEGVSDSPTTLSLGDEEQRESACWVALCAQENLPPAGNIVVWDWETPFVNTAVAEARESMEAKSRIIALGYQQALTQQTLAEARTRIGELSERAREQGERISLLMRLAAQGANADHAAAPAAVPGLASRVRAAQAWKRRNRVRANMGLPAVTGTRPSFLDLGIAAEAKAPVVHLVLAPAAEVALDRIAAAHAAGPRNLRPEIILAHRCAPVRVEGAAVSALPHDKLDAVFHALVRRRPRFLHLHLDGEELPAWAAEIPAVARLLNIPTLATFGLASPVEPLDGACAVFTEWAGESVSESVKFLPPAWPESEPSPITKTGAPILTWLRGGEEGLAAIVAVGEHASLRIATIEDEVENSRWAECVRSHRLAGRCDPVGPVTREEMERLVRSAAVVVANGDASILARAALRAGVPLVAIGSATALLPARRKTHDLDPAAQLRWVLAHPAEASQQALALWKAGRTAASRTPAAARYGELYRELGAKK
jgi:SAM-dependent methyltransferase